MKNPVYYLENGGILHPKYHTRGMVHLMREMKQINAKDKFSRAAEISSESPLKALQTKLSISKELSFKLARDIDNEILVKLSEYLELPLVKYEEISTKNVSEYLCPSTIHLVANSASKGLSICIVLPLIDGMSPLVSISMKAYTKNKIS